MGICVPSLFLSMFSWNLVIHNFLNQYLSLSLMKPYLDCSSVLYFIFITRCLGNFSSLHKQPRFFNLLSFSCSIFCVNYMLYINEGERERHVYEACSTWNFSISKYIKTLGSKKKWLCFQDWILYSHSSLNTNFQWKHKLTFHFYQGCKAVS